MPAASGVSGPTTTEFDLVALAKRDHGSMVGDIKRHAFSLAGDAGIAGRTPEFGHQRRSRNLPRESMFTAAGTEQKDFHFNVGRTKLRFPARA